MSHCSDTSHSVRAAIDPVELHRRLSVALGIRPVGDDEAKLVSLDFPDTASPTFREEYLLKEVLRKYQDFDLGVDRRQAALDSLKEAEAVNRTTNDRLGKIGYGENPRVMGVYASSCRKAAKILGRFRWDWYTDALRFGPGSTTSVKVPHVNLPTKLTGKPQTTAKAKDLAYTLLTNTPCWAYTVDRCVSPETVLEVMDYDVVGCVPKNAHIDRTTASQPDANVVLQLAHGGCMRRRLFEWGVNLNDQTINQRLAWEASKGLTDDATVDVRNASASMTQALVWDHLGNHDHEYIDPRWYEMADAIRTERGQIDGQVRTYEMFVAMGNGYCFELESLIFYTLAVATCEELGLSFDDYRPLDQDELIEKKSLVSVYGDDIILPAAAVPLLEEVFAYAGFQFNRSKTFSNTEGPRFRESCGGHYLDGRDVSPFYVRRSLDNVEDIILLANNLKRWSRLDWGLDGRLKPVYEWIVSHLPKSALQTCIPWGDANDGLIKDFDEARPSVVQAGPPNKRFVIQHSVIGINDPYPERKSWDLTDTGTRGFLRIATKLVRTTDCKQWPVIRVGYKAQTLKMVSRGKQLQDGVGMLVWLYQRSYTRFTPPSDSKILNWDYRRTLPWTPRIEGDRVGLHPSLPMRLDDVRGLNDILRMAPPVPYKLESVKQSLKAGKRCVRHWPSQGPWLETTTSPSSVTDSVPKGRRLMLLS